MGETQKKLMTNWRWWLCSLLFVATTVNYLDRQVLSLTYENFIKPEFHWNDDNYGTITAFFSIFYAIACLFAGKFVDWMGTKKGYLIAIGVWSAGACLHAACGWATGAIVGQDLAALKGVEVASNVALAISTTSVYLFLLCRGILALGEAGNFPAAIKVTAEYFPKKDRAFATSIFNAGASVGALAAPLCIPPLAMKFGWEMAFIIIGALGFIWMFFWAFMYEKPEKSKHVNEAELEYIHQDDADDAAAANAAPKAAEEKQVSLWKCFTFKQTWQFITGKFFTDGVWWFFLFWAPSYFSNQFNAPVTTPLGQWLIFTLPSAAATCRRSSSRRRGCIPILAVCSRCSSSRSSRSAPCWRSRWACTTTPPGSPPSSSASRPPATRPGARTSSPPSATCSRRARSRP